MSARRVSTRPACAASQVAAGTTSDGRVAAAGSAATGRTDEGERDADDEPRRDDDQDHRQEQLAVMAVDLVGGAGIGILAAGDDRLLEPLGPGDGVAWIVGVDRRWC